MGNRCKSCTVPAAVSSLFYRRRSHCPTDGKVPIIEQVRRPAGSVKVLKFPGNGTKDESKETLHGESTGCLRKNSFCTMLANGR